VRHGGGRKIAAIAIALALAATVGCQSEVERKAKTDAAWKDLQDAADGVNYKLEGKFFSTMIETVGYDQGEAVGMGLLLNCQQKGYRIHLSKDGDTGFPVVGYTTETMSNRYKAECDAIIKTENRIQLARNARAKAEEKRKDDAYDKAHTH
jgi:hypothetical protein